ncbi:hypothetical protein ABMA32_03540 [Mesorhizobium sp. VNQ89]|uniref:hypothetical protein n=1 Tax=Mesorhizobium quangtriensis TaxID=3157709 RepID=UPI0032B757A5
MDRPERALTRDDFIDAEDWYRYQHEGGFLRRVHRGQRYVPALGNGPWAQLVNMTHDVREKPERRYSRLSTGLRGKDYERLWSAVALANLKSHVLNVHVTIAWSTVGIRGEADVGEANEKFLERMRHCLDDLAIPHAWIWVLERKSKVGVHSHILVHVPSMYHHAFTNWVRSGFRSATGREPTDAKASKSIVVRLARDRDWNQQWVWLHYLLKGVKRGEAIRDLYDHRARHDIAMVAKLKLRPQGKISIKRSGYAQAVGPKALVEYLAEYPLALHELADRGPITARFLHAGEACRAISHMDI